MPYNTWNKKKIKYLHDIYRQYMGDWVKVKFVFDHICIHHDWPITSLKSQKHQIADMGRTIDKRHRFTNTEKTLISQIFSKKKKWGVPEHAEYIQSMNHRRKHKDYTRTFDSTRNYIRKWKASLGKIAVPRGIPNKNNDPSTPNLPVTLSSPNFLRFIYNVHSRQWKKGEIVFTHSVDEPSLNTLKYPALKGGRFLFRNLKGLLFSPLPLTIYTLVSEQHTLYRARYHEKKLR